MRMGILQTSAQCNRLTLLRMNHYDRKTLSFYCIERAAQVLLLAVVTLKINEQMLELEVAVSDDLRYDTVLGRTVPFLWNLVSHLQVLDYFGMVQTRAQRKPPKQVK